MLINKGAKMLSQLKLRRRISEELGPAPPIKRQRVSVPLVEVLMECIPAEDDEEVLLLRTEMPATASIGSLRSSVQSHFPSAEVLRLAADRLRILSDGDKLCDIAPCAASDDDQPSFLFEISAGA